MIKLNYANMAFFAVPCRLIDRHFITCCTDQIIL